MPDQAGWGRGFADCYATGKRNMKMTHGNYFLAWGEHSGL